MPIDDENTLSIAWFFSRVPKGREPYVQDEHPDLAVPDQGRRSGRWITSHVMNQDFVAWVGQGTNRRPQQGDIWAPSDLGIVMMRHRFFDDLDAMATRRRRQGGHPQREPAASPV